MNIDFCPESSKFQNLLSKQHTMYKWHVNSAIGRGGPFKNDFTRVADGIAASLRQFSVSISRAEEGGLGSLLIQHSLSRTEANMRNRCPQTNES